MLWLRDGRYTYTKEWVCGMVRSRTCCGEMWRYSDICSRNPHGEEDRGAGSGLRPGGTGWARTSDMAVMNRLLYP